MQKKSKQINPVTRFLAIVAQKYVWYLGLCCVVLPYEFVMRLWYHLDPRVYSSAARVRRVSQGRAPKRGEKYILLALFAGHRFPVFTRSLIDAAARTGFNLIISPSGPLSPADHEELLDHAYLLIERTGLGRDFGAYKDGIAILRERCPGLERLVLMNDSVFYFENGLDAMLRALEGPADLIGTTETFEIHYHIQSFILSFSRALMDHPRFKKFWNSYRPISTKRWCIHKGEVGFTRKMTKAGIRPQVLYHSGALGSHLRGRPPRDILAAVQYLPSAHRRRLYAKFDELLQEQMKASRDEVALVGRNTRFISEDGPSGDFTRLAAELTGMLAANSEYQRWKLDGFVEEMVALISRHNQCHTGGFLFMKHLGMPFAKRDLFLREVYTLPEIYDILGDFQEPMREDVMADLRQRGSGAGLKGLWRILHNYGAI